MSAYRCLHCGGVTANHPNPVDALRKALESQEHGLGICIPFTAGDGTPLCDYGNGHYADGATVAQMRRNADGQWMCPEHARG